MFDLLLVLTFVCVILLVVLIAYMLFVGAMFMVDKFLNKGKLKFREYIQYW